MPAATQRAELTRDRTGENLPLVGVVVVNHNRADATSTCIASIAGSRYERVQLLVVDNGSTDRSAEVLMHRHAGLHLIRLESNLGFTGGYNLGIKEVLRLGADLVLLLNDDAIATPDAIGQLVCAASSWPSAGLLGPKLVMLNDPTTILSAGCTLQRGRLTHRGLGERDSAQDSEPCRVDSLSGSALLATTPLVPQTGLLADRSFVY